MFSSGAGSPFGDQKKSSHMINNQYPGYKMESPPGYVPSASPLSQAPSSPYSPGLRPMIRFSSTESVRTNSSSSINLKEDLSELAELQQQTAAAQQVILIFTKEINIHVFISRVFFFLTLYTVSTFGIEKSFGGW